MSFRRDYLPLFSIKLLDNSDGQPIAGGSIVPTRAGMKKLNDHQLIAKSRTWGLQVYYSRNPRAESPVVAEVSTRVRFDFALYLPRSFYSEYLPDISGGEKLHLQNLEGGGAIAVGDTVSIAAGVTVSANDAVFLFPTRFEIEQEVPPGATEYELRAQHDNTVLGSFPVETLGGGDLLEFDLKKINSGRYRLTADTQPGLHTHIFVDNQLASESLQGICTIYLETSQQLAPVNGYQYEARFATR